MDEYPIKAAVDRVRIVADEHPLNDVRLKWNSDGTLLIRLGSPCVITDTNLTQRQGAFIKVAARPSDVHFTVTIPNQQYVAGEWVPGEWNLHREMAVTPQVEMFNEFMWDQYAKHAADETQFQIMRGIYTEWIEEGEALIRKALEQDATNGRD